jgi:Multimeric flavodoxin WrbA
MKKAIILNGSPRKNGNTMAALVAAAQGAEEAGAAVETIHLYDYQFSGCVSCFACKSIDDRFKGRCALLDDLTVILEKIMQADMLILGSPVYLFNITSRMRALLERLVFMNCTYDYQETEKYSIFSGQINVGFIYTMNITKEEMGVMQFERQIFWNEFFLKFFKGRVESLAINDTSQFADYSLYHTKGIDLARKGRVRREDFPGDIQKAYELGKQLV